MRAVVLHEIGSPGNVRVEEVPTPTPGPGEVRVALRASPACYAGVEIPVTVSIGLTTIDPADASVDEVLSRADAALYDAKQAGRDAVVSRQRG